MTAAENARLAVPRLFADAQSMPIASMKPGGFTGVLQAV